MSSWPAICLLASALGSLGSNAHYLAPNRTLVQVHLLSHEERGGVVPDHVLPGARHGALEPTVFSRTAAAPEALPAEDSREPFGTKDWVPKALLGSVLLFMALSVQWFNEERSAKIEVLLTRGLEDCRSIRADLLDPDNRGRLVHVQGRAAGEDAVADPRFQDAVARSCLKLQSTLEVFEWVPTSGFVKESVGQPRHTTEWTTSHYDSSRFRQPSPQNPRLPPGLCLGTRTTSSPHAKLGIFHLTEEMLSHFHSFEPAMLRLPARVHAAGIAFFANPKDGFFYGRPGFTGDYELAQAHMFQTHQVGDLRVRFLCTPECDATVVAVQCHKDKLETFVPYRVVAQAPCDDEQQERLRLVEEGDKTLRELRRDGNCCAGGVVTCCCCPCNTMACFTSQEVLTEEIFYVSDRKDPPEKPFRKAVSRNPWLLWNWRLLGWLMMYCVLQFAQPHLNKLFDSLGLARLPTMLNLFMLTLVLWALVVAAAYARYRPSMGIKYCVMVAIIVGIPVLYNQMNAPA
mmetsp:Transcript_27334/g.51159  ORF Transcript_27334/g.51159 Transcript_27334/m.51159 type:complete len:515 (+) Transcript_27334:79-1623(+)